MTTEKYTKISPEGMFSVAVNRSLEYCKNEMMKYEYTFTIDVKPTQNDFINMFAGLVARHGKCSSLEYAKMMGIDETYFNYALIALTGVGIREWTDAMTAAVAETLLRETSLPVYRIAESVGLSTERSKTGMFCRWFVKRYKCTPRQWKHANN